MMYLKYYSQFNFLLSKTMVSLSPSSNALDKDKSSSFQFPPVVTDGGVSSAFGSQIDDVMANRIKTTPPISVTKKKVK